SATALRDFLEQRLPSYMIPASFLFLDRLPLTVNGKVDRKALPEPERSRDLLETEYVAPISATEQTIAHIWSEVLGIDQIGSQDNFFLLGGHSLLATQVYTRLRRALQIDIPLRVLFEAPTITELAIQVERVRQDIEAQTPPIDTIPTGKLEGPLPLSFAQERLWFLEQLQPGSPQYTIAMAVRIEGLLNLTFLRSSLTYLLERHAILRSVYTFREGTPVQHIQPVEDFALPLQDVTSEAEALSILQAEGTRPFDLIYGPLLHAQVLRIDSACHILFLAFHHSVVDGWSLGIIIRDLAISYQAAMTDQQPDLPPLAIQYPDYARWQRSSAHQSIFTGQLAYWQRQLHEPPVLELPLDHPRPLVMSGRGAVHTQTWNTALLQQLHDCSNHEGVTLFMLLLAAFQVLVMRYSGQEDLIIGSPIANRTRVETEELVGCFVNTLPLRADLHGNPSFRQFLTRIRAIVLEAYEHQDIPFEQVVQELPIERHLNRSPLVQVLFVLQNAPLPTHHIPGLQWHGWPVETQTAKFEITWQLEETEQGLTSRIEYATDLFTEATIARMQQHYQQLLHSILLDCTQPIWQLNLLAPAERVTLLQHWSVTKAEVPAFAYIDELFEQQALRTPEREALYCNGEHLTYLELEQRANQFAHYLRSQGVGPEITVGICLEREPELLIALLGTLKAGGAYVPLDPHYPAARQTYMLEDSRAQVLVTRLSQVLSHTPTRSCQVLAWEQFQPTLATQPVTRPDRVGRYPEQLAYLIYTSGSTGQPKGASITHRSAVNLLAWAQQTFSPTQLAHVLASTSICFDLSIFEIFAPLCVGGRVIMVKNLLQLIDADFREEITLINTVPSAITALMRAQRLPSHVQIINLAGETYQPQIVTAIYEQCPSAQLWNLYGPSETTTYSSGALITTDAQDVTTIGRPLMNTEIYVLDRYGQPVAVGLVGEIYIGGAGLARCYFQRPDLTAERFVPHPWSLTPGARLYYTGDRARYNPDGQLHFLGRSDTQVKLRGFRIEPDEIGRALCQLPFVQEAAIVLREIRPGEQGLVAYLVGVMEDQISDEALREHLRQWLPDYMLPVVFMRLPALPLTPSGKLDKRALPHPSLRHPFEHGSYAAPKTELEQALVTIWQEVLQIDSPGVLDNFFDLGGHSLLLLQLYSKIQERLGYDITVVDLFQYPTIQALATFLSGKSSQLALQRASRDRADTRKTLMKQQQTLRRSRSAQ
ncbi:MAG TPA: amino acid adenylation domain-containing protein, partial [Ktedonobacteraceae bacterium]|nr:amino acid adenylation domain-containing protein [Ktedonobacteraceae bacterium]